MFAKRHASSPWTSFVFLSAVQTEPEGPSPSLPHAELTRILQHPGLNPAGRVNACLCVRPSVYSRRAKTEGYSSLYSHQCPAHNGPPRMFAEWGDSWYPALLLYAELDKNRTSYSQSRRGILMWTFGSWTRHNKLPKFIASFKGALVRSESIMSGQHLERKGQTRDSLSPCCYMSFTVKRNLKTSG